MFDSLKVSAISLRPVKWDKDANADKMESFFVEAAKDKPNLILTTEGVLEGYVVMDVIHKNRTPEEMLDLAEPINGPYIRRFQRVAKSLNICISFGFAERIGTDIYNSAIFIEHDGQIAGKYHKTQLAEGTHLSWSFNRVGQKLRAFNTSLGRVGIVICNDRWNPLITRTLVLDGANLILIPSYGSKSKAQNQTVLARARENGVPIVEANVGMNLIISQGEVVAYKWGNDQITTAMIEIPKTPCEKNARISEKNYLQQQKIEMEKRYQQTINKG